MTTKLNQNVPEILKDLSSGYSNHNKFVNTHWFAIAIISILILMPGQESSTAINLPFNIGQVKNTDFYPFAAVLLGLLIISFGSIQIRSVRTKKLIEKVICEIKEKDGNIYGIDLRDIFDSIIEPSIFRLAPIAQFIRGKYQFFHNSENCPKYLKILSTFYFFILKLISYLVIYFLPFYAMLKCYQLGDLLSTKYQLMNIPIVIIWAIDFLSLIVLLQLFISDFTFFIKSLKNIYKSWTYN